MPSFGKRTPFNKAYLTPFEAVYGDKADGSSPRKEGDWAFTKTEGKENQELNEENSRWRKFSREWIAENKGDSLDISWLKDDDSVDIENLPPPEDLASLAMTELTDALAELEGLLTALGEGDVALAQKQLLAESLGLDGVTQ